MLKAEDLINKTYSEAYSKLGLETNLLDNHNGDLEIRDVFEAETVLGIYEALQPKTNSPTLTEKYSKLRTLADYLAPKLGRLRNSKVAAVAAAASLTASVIFSGVAKDLSPSLPDIIMEDASAQDDRQAIQDLISAIDIQHIKVDSSGNQILFLEYYEWPDWRLTTIDKDGAVLGQMNIYDSPDDEKINYDIKPSGERIVYSNGNLKTYNLNGGEEIALNGTDIDGVDWSAKDNRIYYASENTYYVGGNGYANNTIFSIDENNNILNLGPYARGSIISGFLVNPLENEVAYTHGTLYVLDLDTNIENRLYENTVRGFDYNSKGELSYVRDSSAMGILVYDDKSTQLVSTIPTSNSNFDSEDGQKDLFTTSWSPDGKYIAYAVYDDENKENIEVVSADGMKKFLVANTKDIEYNPVWISNNELIYQRYDTDNDRDHLTKTTVDFSSPITPQHLLIDIKSPKDGQTVATDTNFSLEAVITNNVGANSFIWRISGPINTEFGYPNENVNQNYKLHNPGEYEIKLLGEKSGVQFAYDSITITVSDSIIPPPPKPQCSDSIDNDGDGLIDYTADPGCESASDDDEFNNTIDNPPITPKPNITDNPPIKSELEKLIEKHSPTYLFSKDETYFPTDPYADDSDVTNNALNWQKAEFPKENKAIYYAVTDYSNTPSPEHPEGFKVIQYWSHYVYNDWGSDDHKYDWEVIHKWVDNKSGNVFHTSASMHFWDNNYQEDVSRIFVEEGGHGMSQDRFMLDHIEMSFNDGGEIQDKNSYELLPLEDLLKYDAGDFFGERGKFPTEQDRYKDPDMYVRLNPTHGVLTQISIKNSPELSVTDSLNRTTGLQNNTIVEVIPNSKYFPKEEKIIVLGNEDLDIHLIGTVNEDYALEVKKVNGTKEDIIVKNGSIKHNEQIKLEFSDSPKKDDDFDTTPQNTQKYYPIIAAISGSVAAAIGLTAYRRLRNKKATKSQIIPTKIVLVADNKLAVTSQIKPNKDIDDSEDE